MLILETAILSRLVRPVEENQHTAAEGLAQAAMSLDPLIPNATDVIRGNTVLDFGSGEGWHALVFGEWGAQKVFGIEIEEDKIMRSRQRAEAQGLQDKVLFHAGVPPEAHHACDLIFSRDSMEHYQDPEGVLKTMKECLKPGGRIIISFGPTWYSPYGAHMNYFIPVPWVHLLFSEKSIMTVRRQFRDDGADRYSQVPGGLNQMSVRRFKRLIENCGLRVSMMKLHCVKGKAWLGKLPILRELFINSIVCHLETNEP